MDPTNPEESGSGAEAAAPVPETESTPPATQPAHPHLTAALDAEQAVANSQLSEGLAGSTRN